MEMLATAYLLHNLGIDQSKKTTLLSEVKKFDHAADAATNGAITEPWQQQNHHLTFPQTGANIARHGQQCG